MEGHLWMSAKERERLKIFERVKRGELRKKDAAVLCGLDYRYVRRLYKRYCALGDRGLVHQGRGRPSNRAHKADFRAAVLQLYQERYSDFGPTLAMEKLALAGYVLDHDTLRGWLVKAGLWQKRRKRGRHRSWRARRAHFGELVQLDGSHHKWFEERGPKGCLMNMVDDAQGTTLSLLAEEETSFAAMALLWRWIERYGIPQSLYTDKKNVYVIDEKTRARAADSGEEVWTHFGWACQQLGIEIITAHSPEAKGRVERNHGVYQDRLVKELRLAGINTIAAANELLAAGFCEQLNQKFAVVPRSAVDYHRSAKGYDLASVFCLEEERALSADWVVRFENQFYQLQPPRKALAGKRRVRVQRYLNGELHFRYGELELCYTLLPERPQPLSKAKKTKQRRNGVKPYVPPREHAWRKFQFGKGAPWLSSEDLNTTTSEGVSK
jgi:transposase